MNVGKRVSGVAKAVQHFKPLPEEAMDTLIRQGDVLWCAGGFAIGTAKPHAPLEPRTPACGN
jgi:predicted house-cleaning NTP pyrophosphatase (Maf/HAM1 superfamily)